MNEKLINALSTLTAIKDPSMLIFLTAIIALGVVGMAIYALIIALKRSESKT